MTNANQKIKIDFDRIQYIFVQAITQDLLSCLNKFNVSKFSDKVDCKKGCVIEQGVQIFGPLGETLGS